MKKCSKCQAEYFDQTLEFCLEDGSRLISDGGANANFAGAAEKKTVFQEKPATAAPTISFGSANNTVSPEIETVFVEKNKANSPLQIKTEKIKNSAINKWLEFLETAPIVLALIHNFWQWLYLVKLTYGGFVEYFLSSSFLIWLLLLIFGAGLSIVSLKYGKSRKFAVAALVVLAINVLLYIVPK